MKYILLVLSLVSHCASAQQLTKQQLTRLSDACKLWGHVKYFHPYLQYKTIPWDSAFAVAVPEILSASSPQEYKNSLSKWLAILGDPATKVSTNDQTTLLPSINQASPVVTIQDSVLTFTINNLIDLENYDSVKYQVKKLLSLPRNVKYILFDLRVDQVSEENQSLEWFFSDYDIDVLLGSRLTQPALRSVAYDGFPGESQSSGSYYTTYFKVFNGKVMKTTSDRNFPVAFLVNANVALPYIALMLQQAGRAIILSEGKLNKNFDQNFLSYPISDSLLISIRTGELMIQNKVIDIHPNLELEKENDPRINAMKAIALLKNGYPLLQNQIAVKNDIGVTKSDIYPRNYPGVGYRALAAAKIYTVINSFFPNKYLMDRDWDSVFEEFLPRFITAKDNDEYNLAILEMYAHIQDGHGFISGTINWIGKFVGNYQLPVLAKVIENKLVVTTILNDSVAKQAGIEVGDIIKTINGKDPLKMIDELRKYLAASNTVTQTARLARSILLVEKDSMLSTLEIKDRKGKNRQVAIMSDIRNNNLIQIKGRPLDQGPIFKLLNSDLGYVDLHRLERRMVDSMFETFRNTKGIIMDMRGYPKGTAWTIAPRLSEKNHIEAALFTRVMPQTLLSNPESDLKNEKLTYTFIQKLPETTKWRYKGKTVMLMNEETQSQAEHTGLFLKAANGTLFIGSQTAGANGDITNFNVPGNINLTFSGQNVSYPNGQTMQRTGLIPDVLVLPTIKGIREGRDEVLEKAIEVLQKIK